MYWGQISIALFAATVTFGISYQHGQPALVAVLMATITYVIVRWLVAWGVPHSLLVSERYEGYLLKILRELWPVYLPTTPNLDS